MRLKINVFIGVLYHLYSTEYAKTWAILIPEQLNLTWILHVHIITFNNHFQTY